MLRICFLFFFLLSPAYARPTNLPVKKIQGLFFVAVSDLPGIRFFEDKARGRLLLEGKARDQQAFFLWDTYYAIIDNRFVALEMPPTRHNGQVYLPADFVRFHLLDWVSDDPKNIADKKTDKKLELKTPAPAPAKKEELALAGPQLCSSVRKVEKVFLDPGHGGSDLGASFRGVYEKDVTLRFSQLMADELRRLGFKVAYSRTKDVFLPLDIRSQLAREWGADAFISLHMNSAKVSEAHGTETYILSNESTDNEARKLALAENTIVKDLKENANNPLRDILWDMEQTQYLQLSAHLAAKLHKSIMASSEKKLRNRGVRQAPFFVLSRASMPAVLLELGYLSNSKDRAVLTNEKNQITLAKALAEGVKNYASFCFKRK